MATAIDQNADAAVIRASLAACLTTLEGLGPDVDPAIRVRVLGVASSIAASLAKVHDEAQTVAALRAVLARQVERLEEVAGQVGILRDVVNGLVEQHAQELDTVHARFDRLESRMDASEDHDTDTEQVIQALQGTVAQVRRELGDFAVALRTWHALDTTAEGFAPAHGTAELVDALSALEGNR